MSDSKSADHWRQLAQLLGTEVPPEPELTEPAPPVPAVAEAVATVPELAVPGEESAAPAREPARPKPAPAPAKPERPARPRRPQPAKNHWGQVASQLGIEVPDLEPPVPEEPLPAEVPVVEEVAIPEPESAQPESSAPRDVLEGPGVSDGWREARPEVSAVEEEPPVSVETPGMLDAIFDEELPVYPDEEISGPWSTRPTADEDLFDVGRREEEARPTTRPGTREPRRETDREPPRETEAEAGASRRKRRRRGRRRRGGPVANDLPEAPVGEPWEEELEPEEMLGSEASVAFDEEREDEPGGEVVEDESQRRGRRRRRRRSPRPEQEERPQRPEIEERESLEEVEDRFADDLDEEPEARESAPALAECDHDEELDAVGEDDDSDAFALKHRNIPTWEEAVGSVIAGNMESRAKNPGGGQRGRGRGRDRDRR